MSRLAIWRQAATGWIYPPGCAGCELPLTSQRQIDLPFLCVDCEDKLAPIPEGYCPVCGQSYDTPVGMTFRCGNCGDRELAFDFAVSAYRSSGEAREMMHAYKYGKQVHLSRLMGKLMQRIWDDTRLREIDTWLVVPVPLHPKRQQDRGFNQSHEIAREFIRTAPPGIKLKLSPLLKRTRHTVRQAQLDRRERLNNLKGAFKLRKKLTAEIVNEHGILLIDDVMTTGTTVSECAEILRAAGDAVSGEWPGIVGLSVLRG